MSKIYKSSNKQYLYPRDYKFDLTSCEKCHVVFRPTKPNQHRCSVQCATNSAICDECNTKFEYYYKKKPRKFCSKLCAGKHSRRRIIKKCLNCNIDIDVIICNIDKTKYCSRKCKDEYQKILFSGENNPNYGNHILLGVKHTNEQNERCRQAVLNHWKTDERRHKHFEAMDRFKEKYGYYPLSSPKAIDNLRNSMHQRMLDGMWKPKLQGKSGYYFSIKTNINEYYHSAWEMTRMIELDTDENVLYWTKKHKIHINITPTNKYYPDFLITYKNNIKIIEEVKGYVRNVELFDLKCESAIKFIKENNNIDGYVVNFMNHLRNEKNKNYKEISYYKI